MTRILVVVIVLGVLAYFNGFFDQFIADFKVGYSGMSDITCEDIAKKAKGQVLKNNFGFTFEIIEVFDLQQIKKTEKEILCTGSAYFDDASERKLNLRMFEKGDNHFFEFKEIL